MSVKTSAQALLVQEMCNQTDATAQDKQTIENTHAQVVFGLLGRERSATSDQVDEADCNAAINVEDQVVFLAGCDRLHGLGVVEQRRAREVLVHKLLHERHTKIRIVSRLDTVANTGD